MKITVITGVASAAIGIFLGVQIPHGIVSKPVSVTTFSINVPFDQWARGFDSENAKKMHKAYELKPLFRGFKIDDPTKVIVIHQSNPGSVEKVLSENQDMIEAGGHIMRTTRTTNWSF